MSTEAWLLLLVLIGVAAAFVWDRYPPTAVALIGLAILVLTDVVRIDDALSGFANPATVSVAGLFVLSAALMRSGALRGPSRLIVKYGTTPLRLLAVCFVVVAPISAFVNNTAAVAVFLPLVLLAAHRHGMDRREVLIPLSYAAQMGGICTLVGTSTNLLVSSVAVEADLPPITFFAPSPVGFPLLLIGAIVLVVGRRWLLPFSDSTPEAQSEAIDYTIENPPRRPRITFAIFLAVITLSALEVLPLPLGVLLGIAAVIGAGVMSFDEVIRAIDWRVITLLALMIPLGGAMSDTGLAQALVGNLLDATGTLHPWLALLAIYLATALLTEFMSNNATAVLLAPIAISTAVALGVDPLPFLLAVMVGASAAFATPVGYQTNTMVHRAGGYRFADFLRAGVPLNLIYGLAAVLLIPWVYPF